MKLIILFSIITALCAFYLFHPLMKSRHKAMQKRGKIAIILFPLAALMIYLWLGNPEFPSHPALFEKTGPRAEQRALMRKEMDLMKQLARAPDNAKIVMALGAVRLETGRPEEAIQILQMGHQQHPDNSYLTEELAAAHYAAALISIRMGEERGRALSHFGQAVALTPKDALFRKQLEADYKAFKQAPPFTPAQKPSK